MITVYDAAGGKLVPRSEIGNLANGAVWIDVLNPAEDEDKIIEQALGIEVPTRSEMREIEASNRFYTENGAYYMTGIIVHNSSQDVPLTSVITFILAGTRLVTVRYADPRAFPLYVARAAKGDPGCHSGSGIMIGLIEMLIEREADLIEKVQDQVERMAPLVFGQKGVPAPRDRRLDVLLKTVGKEGDVTARAQESAMSLHRLLLYFANAVRERKDDKRIMARIESANHDITSLDGKPALPVGAHGLPARCHARHDLDRAEPDHQALLGHGGDVDAADAGRLDLRHELQAHAGARGALGIPVGALSDVFFGPCALSLLPQEGLALKPSGRQQAAAKPRRR